MVNWFQLESARRGDSKSYLQYMTGAPVAKWVKRWPTDLAVLISSPARSEFLIVELFYTIYVEEGTDANGKRTSRC